jgi:hypothetical protein
MQSYSTLPNKPFPILLFFQVPAPMDLPVGMHHHLLHFLQITDDIFAKNRPFAFFVVFYLQFIPHNPVRGNSDQY